MPAMMRAQKMWVLAVLAVGVHGLDGSGGGKKGPLTSSEKAAVGNALKGALGALQGHGGGSKMSSCMDFFSDGPPADKDKSAMWQSCKDVLPANFGSKKHGALLEKKRPLMASEKAAVGDALKGALGALQGHGGGSKYSSCMQYFSDGKPPANPAKDVMWQSCKEVLGSDYFAKSQPKAAALLAANKGVTDTLTASQKAAVGDALAEAMGALQGKKPGQMVSKATKHCEALFPKENGAPKDLWHNTDWEACKDQLPQDYFGGSAMNKMLEALSGAHHH